MICNQYAYTWNTFKKMTTSYRVYTNLSWQCDNGNRRWWPNWYRKCLCRKQGNGNSHNHLILLLHLSCAGDSGLTSHESQALDKKPWKWSTNLITLCLPVSSILQPSPAIKTWLSLCCTLINYCYKCTAMWTSRGTVEQLTEQWQKSIVVWRKPCKNKQIES
jgi:hypothetical protein